MLTKREKDIREQAQIITMDSIVPKDHILRMVDEAIDFDFIYDLVEDKYCLDNGRPSIDPVVLIKLPIIQYLCDIKSMRQTITEVEVNVACRWFLGLDMNDPVPHFSTFGKNYTRRFKDTDLFEQIFYRILKECVDCGFVDMGTIFLDGTHVKARANRNKHKNRRIRKAARVYEETLQEEITKDREAHGKKPLKDRDDDDPGSGPVGPADEKAGTMPASTENTAKMVDQKVSTTDPESGWFHKGEHKEVFAYNAQCACDGNGWILAYDLQAGNVHDSVAFWGIYEKIKAYGPDTLVADAGYKVPAIAKRLLDDGIIPNFPYTRPRTKKGYLYKSSYVYDEGNDCYLCPQDQILSYSTTNREGYREYKSDPHICRDCPYLMQCTRSKNHTKVITRHVWADYMDICEEIRHTFGRKEQYKKRKETIERDFGTAKEYHGMRYTQYIGKARVAMQVGLTFACMNLKKLAILKRMRGMTGRGPSGLFSFLHRLSCFKVSAQQNSNFQFTSKTEIILPEENQVIQALEKLEMEVSWTQSNKPKTNIVWRNGRLSLKGSVPAEKVSGPTVRTTASRKPVTTIGSRKSGGQPWRKKAGPPPSFLSPWTTSKKRCRTRRRHRWYPHPDAGGHHHDPGWRLPGNHPGRPEGHDRVMLGDITRADKIYIACGYTDMRKAIDGLAAIVRENFHMNPMENNLFLFCGKRRDRLKALYWEGDGFILLYKRLEDGYVKTFIM